MNQSKYFKIVTITALVILDRLIAQPVHIKFDEIGLQQGLSQSTVYTITQDIYGFMWFGTQDGLNRYDGYSITVFKHSSTDPNSISDNAIWTLLSDSKGDLWIGTMHGGINRYVYSENKFYHYNSFALDNTSINDNNITSLYEDTRGNIWIGTYSGNLYRFNREMGNFTKAQINANDSGNFVKSTIWYICEDNKERLWLVTNRGLYYVQNRDQTQFSIATHSALNRSLYFNFKNETKLSFRSLQFEEDGTFWIGTWGWGILSFNEKTNTIKRYRKDRKNNASVSADFIKAIYKDSKGNLWVGTQDKGLMLYDLASDNFIPYTNDDIMTLYEDRSGIIWIGTYTNGVLKYDKHRKKFKHYLNGINTTSIFKDRNGILWVGTFGSGLKIFDSKLKEIKTFNSDLNDKYSISGNKIFSLFESSQGDMWVGTESGLCRYNKMTGRFTRYKHDPFVKSSIGFEKISVVYEDLNGNLWIGSANGGVARFDYLTNKFTNYSINEINKNALNGNAVTVIYQGKKSGLWIGTFEGGVNLFSKKTNSFRNYQTSSKQNESINNNTVFSIYEDKNGFVWMGTYGGGLNKYDPFKGSFKYYTLEHGLSNDIVYGILPDADGNLWLSTNEGITRFNIESETFRNYDVKDGLQSNEFNQGAYFVSSSGELFIGGVNGFNSFFPADIIDNDFIPPVYITIFKVFDKILPLAYPLDKVKPIELSYDQNFFSFEFVALNYTSPEKNQYAYKLEGFDKNWHFVPSSKRYAGYTNLDPGKYVLHVKGSNNDGVWNEKGSSITIIIKPPFWMTWWFKILISILILLFTSVSIRYFVKKRIEERTKKSEQLILLEKERLRIARDIHDDLGARLTQVRLQCELVKNDYGNEASIVLNDISESVKNIILTLSEIVWSLNPKYDTLENLAAYLGQYAIELLSRVQIRCRLDIQEEFPKINVNSVIRHNIFLSFKEALNNAVKYSGTECILVRISSHTDFQKHNVLVTIRDYGKGFNLNDESTWGNGIKNINDRIKSIGGNFSIQSMDGQGTSLIMNIPFPNKTN